MDTTHKLIITMQYHLSLALEPNATFNNFYCANDYTTALLTQIQEQSTALLLIGGSGSGKTHLLQAACHHQQGQWLYLDGYKVHQVDPIILDNLEGQLICVDNLEALCKHKAWQDALFTLLLVNHNRLLCSAASASVHSDRQDLQSRIQAMLTLKLPTLDENQQAQALLHKAQRKGFPLPLTLVQWMQKNLPRDNHYLFAFIDELTEECSRLKKKPSIPFAKILLSQHNQAQT